MKTKHVIAAINVLKAAEALLNKHAQKAYLEGDVKLATECFLAGRNLENDLLTHFPQTPITDTISEIDAKGEA